MKNKSIYPGRCAVALTLFCATPAIGQGTSNTPMTGDKASQTTQLTATMPATGNQTTQTTQSSPSKEPTIADLTQKMAAMEAAYTTEVAAYKRHMEQLDQQIVDLTAKLNAPALKDVPARIAVLDQLAKAQSDQLETLKVKARTDYDHRISFAYACYEEARTQLAEMIRQSEDLDRELGRNQTLLKFSSLSDPTKSYPDLLATLDKIRQKSGTQLPLSGDWVTNPLLRLGITVVSMLIPNKNKVDAEQKRNMDSVLFAVTLAQSFDDFGQEHLRDAHDLNIRIHLFRSNAESLFADLTATIGKPMTWGQFKGSDNPEQTLRTASSALFNGYLSNKTMLSGEALRPIEQAEQMYKTVYNLVSQYQGCTDQYVGLLQRFSEGLSNLDTGLKTQMPPERQPIATKARELLQPVITSSAEDYKEAMSTFPPRVKHIQQQLYLPQSLGIASNSVP